MQNMEGFRWTLFFKCLILLQVTATFGYKPVVLIHGLVNKPRSLNNLSDYITKRHPGTNVTIINLYQGWHSIAPMWRQVQKFGKVVAEIQNNSKTQIHIIGYSQGGLIARGILSTMDHNVDTFISLSAPQMGEYGAPWYMKRLFPKYVKKDLYKILYSRYGQQISLGNYWNDPHHQDLYEKYSLYLAVLNNDTFNPNSKIMRRNFLKINRLVLIGGPDDGIISPWQSSQFGYYDDKEHIVEMEKQKVFKEDTFGLATLHQRKDMQICTMEGVNHFQWHSNETVFENCILPWLT